MRNITVAPDGELAYHKLVVAFTVDSRSKINVLDRFSLKNLAPFTDHSRRTIQ